MIDFEKMIANHLAHEPREKEVGRYYPSSIGMCMRKYWYSYKYPQELDPRVQKIFHLGNVLHDFVVDVIRSEKNPDVELIKSEMPVRLELEDFTISGRIDDVILVKTNGMTVLVEVKSVKEIRYQTMPSKQHIMQLQFYMYATGIHDGILLYIDKIALDSRIFEIKYDEDEANKIIKRFSAFHTLLKNSVLPEPEARKNEDMRWMCRYCEYAERCGKE